MLIICHILTLRLRHNNRFHNFGALCVNHSAVAGLLIWVDQ